MSIPLHPDHNFVLAAHRREPAGVAWLVERLTGIPRVIQALAAHAGLSQWDLADTTQEAVLTVLDRLSTYHGLAPFDAWVHRICQLTLKGAMRRRHRHLAPGVDHDPPAPEASPADTAAADERRRSVRAAIDAIGGVEADVLRLRLESLSFADIAARTGIAMATLRTRYYRGLRKLHLRLSPGDQHP